MAFKLNQIARGGGGRRDGEEGAKIAASGLHAPTEGEGLKAVE